MARHATRQIAETARLTVGSSPRTSDLDRADYTQLCVLLERTNCLEQTLPQPILVAGDLKYLLAEPFAGQLLSLALGPVPRRVF